MKDNFSLSFWDSNPKDFYKSCVPAQALHAILEQMRQEATAAYRRLGRGASVTFGHCLLIQFRKRQKLLAERLPLFIPGVLHGLTNEQFESLRQQAFELLDDLPFGTRVPGVFLCFADVKNVSATEWIKHLQNKAWVR